MSNTEYHAVDITLKKYISSLDDLIVHPNITFVIEGIFDFVIFEFYDNIFKLLHSYDPEVHAKVHADHKIVQKGLDLRTEKEKLLAPMYALPEVYDKYGQKLQCKECRIQIFNPELNWWKHYYLIQPCGNRVTDILIPHPIPNDLEIEIELSKKLSKKARNMYDTFLLQWQEWVQSHNATILLKDSKFDEKEIILYLSLGNTYDDYLAMLLMLLRHYRKEMSIRNFHFRYK